MRKQGEGKHYSTNILMITSELLSVEVATSSLFVTQTESFSSYGNYTVGNYFFINYEVTEKTISNTTYT